MNAANARNGVSGAHPDGAEPSRIQADVTPAESAVALREVRRGVAQAADAKLLQVVRALDALADRGVADAVLARYVIACAGSG